jgi:hypothetical protein
VIDARGQGRCEYDTTCGNGVEVGLCSVTAQAFPGAVISGHVLYLNPDFVLARVAWDFMSRFVLPDGAKPAVEGTLAGPDRIKLRGQGRVRRKARLAPLVWTMRLGEGTWAAAGDGAALTGSWRRAKGRARSGVATLTTAGREELEALAADRIAASSGTSGLQFTLEPIGPIRIAFDGRKGPKSLRGRWRILRGSEPGGPEIGRYTARLRRRR